MKDFKDKSKIQVSNVSKNMFDRKYSEGKSNSNKKDTIRRNGKIGVKSNNTRELNRGFEASRTVGRFEKNSFFCTNGGCVRILLGNAREHRRRKTSLLFSLVLSGSKERQQLLFSGSLVASEPRSND